MKNTFSKRFVAVVASALFAFGCAGAGAAEDAEPGIRWKDWNREAFELARGLKRPVLLSIRTSWCHWCHVMDRETYGDPRVREFINSNFVAIRVNSDERPDINERYNMGGWPSTVFLTSRGKILNGATFLTPEQMLEAMQKIIWFYEESREKVETEKALEAGGEDSLAQDGRASKAPLPLDDVIVDRVVAKAVLMFDAANGGFDAAAKFPRPGVTELLLLEYEKTGDRKNIEMAELTLAGLSKLYDAVSGGFFRYATEPDWSEPHYEKLAGDNAEIARIYLLAYLKTQEPDYKKIAEGTLDYISRVLFDPEKNLFCFGQDADLQSAANTGEFVPGEKYYSFSGDVRERVGAPKVDRRLVSGVSAACVRAFVSAYNVFGKASHKNTARAAMDSVVNNFYVEGEGVVHSLSGDWAGLFFLSDQTAVVAALLDCYESFGNEIYLEFASEIAELTLRKFGGSDGALKDFSGQGSAVGLLSDERFLIKENSEMARCLLRLQYLKGEAKYREAARGILEFFAPKYEIYDLFSARYAAACYEYFNEPVVARIIGRRLDRGTDHLRRAALESPVIWKVVQVLDSAADGEMIEKLKLEVPKIATAFVSLGWKSEGTAKRASKLRKLMEGLRAPRPRRG